MDAIPRILAKLEEVRRRDLTCFGSGSHGYRLNPPLDEAAVRRAYERSGRIFDFEYLKIASYDDIHRILDTPIRLKHKEDFKRAVKVSQSMDTVQYEHISGYWPFTVLWEIRDEIFRLEEGEISSPLETSNGIYIIYMKSG